MSKITTLYSNRWISIMQKELSNGIKWIYTHDTWCKDGIGVGVLPFYIDTLGNLNIVGRFELCPAHTDIEDELKLGIIKGGYDNSDVFTVEQCALNELEEEGGYIAPVESLISLGTVRPSKSSDTIMYLYAVNIKDESVKTCNADGDGSLSEENAYCDILNSDYAIGKTEDTTLISAIKRLELTLKNK